MDSVKIRLVFLSRQGKKAVKVWHFNPDETENVTLEGMEEEIPSLLPDIQDHGLGLLQFKYRDSFADNACNALHLVHMLGTHNYF